MSTGKDKRVLNDGERRTYSILSIMPLSDREKLIQAVFRQEDGPRLTEPVMLFAVAAVTLEIFDGMRLARSEVQPNEIVGILFPTEAEHGLSGLKDAEPSSMTDLICEQAENFEGYLFNVFNTNDR